MAAGTRVLCFLIICSLVCSSRAQEIIQAVIGQNVTLTCKAPNKYNIIITAVEWSRPEMEPDYVLLYRYGRLVPHGQHPSYQNRVDLQDKEMKDRDFSLILKNVKMEDNGTYMCHVFEKGKKYPISMTLEVHVSGNKNAFIGDGGDKDGGDKDINTRDGGNKTGIIAGSVVGVILLLLVVAALGFLISRWRRRQNPNLPVPPDEAAAIEMFPVPEQHQNHPELV